MRMAGVCRVRIQISEGIKQNSKMAVFWIVAPYSLVEFYQRFRGPCCLHHQGNERPDDGGSKDI
jgi:hypothetical protein